MMETRNYRTAWARRGPPAKGDRPAGGRGQTGADWFSMAQYGHESTRVHPAPESQVLVSVDATSKKRAFEEAGLLFENLHGLSRALITDSLFARERLGSTGLGHGVAIPHGRIKGLKAPMAAVFQLAQPIGFDAPDEQPVGC
jgi:hypothetical protein